MSNVDTVINAHAYEAASLLSALAKEIRLANESNFFQSAAVQIGKSVNKLLLRDGTYPSFFRSFTALFAIPSSVYLAYRH